MSTFIPDFAAGSTVWTITTATTTCVAALRSGVVIQAIATELTSGTTYTYDIRLSGDSGTTRVVGTNIFNTLNEATAEYFTRLGGVPNAGSPVLLVL